MNKRGAKCLRGCCFFGHRNCPSEIEFCLSSAIERLITTEGVTRFFVGTQGSFDKLAHRVLCEIEKSYPIQIFVVLAYLNQPSYEKDYDPQKTIFPDILTKTPPRFAIKRRNSFMIDYSEYVIAYLNEPYSNTHNLVIEASKKKKAIINLGGWRIDFD